MKTIVGLIQVQLRLLSKYAPQHTKKIKPGYFKAKPTEKRREDDLLTKMNKNRKMETELYNEFQGTGELQEPDASQLGNVYYVYQRDKRKLDFKMKQGQMFRKHFKEFVRKDPSVLTYAEKENIRYLHKSDPDHWTPEKIAESFPVTPDGAANLVKCKFSTKTQKEITEHDLGVAKNIKLITEGVIKLSPGLAEKMTMREKTPITIGVYPYNPSNLPVSNTTRSVCGEFERLVAAPNSTSKSFTATKVVSSSVEFDETEKLMTEMRNPKRNEELLKLNIAPNKYMTLNEFETKVKTSIEKDSSISDPQLDYLLSLDDKTLLDSNVAKASGDMWAGESSYENKDRLRKYKNSNRNENDGDEFGDPALLSATDSPITLLEDVSEPTEKIEIPKNIRKPGALYKVRDCYFDENGEFLYRVI